MRDLKDRISADWRSCEDGDRPRAPGGELSGAEWKAYNSPGNPFFGGLKKQLLSQSLLDTFGPRPSASCPNIGFHLAMVAAGPNRTVLLRSDGRAVYCGEPPAHGAAPKRWSGSCLWVQQGQCEIPPLDAGQFYTQVSAGHNHTVVLRSDGVAVACGHNLSSSATFRLWNTAWPTHKLQRVGITQCFFVVMAMP